MRRDSRAVHLVRRLRVVALGFLLAMVGSTMAQNPPIEGKYTIVARSVRPISGPTVNIGMEARLAANPTLYASERAVLTAATTGTLVRGVLSRANAAVGVYYGVKAVMDAAGWAINELGTQVTSPAVGQEQLAPGSVAWCTGYSAVEQRCVTTLAGAKRVCDALAATVFAASIQPVTCTTTEPWDGVNTMAVWAQNGQGNLVGQFALYRTSLATWTPNWSTGTDPQVITDEQIFNALKQSRPDLFAQLLKDENGNVIITPEVADALNRFRQAVEAATGVQGVPVVSDPGAVESGEGDSSPKSLPEFCEWADVVCDFITWFKGEETTEHIEPEWDDDIPEPQHYASAIPNSGTCPAPEVAEFWGQQVQFSYQPICDFASYLRPLLLVAAGLAAAYIVAGVRNV